MEASGWRLHDGHLCGKAKDLYLDAKYLGMVKRKPCVTSCNFCDCNLRL